MSTRKVDGSDSQILAILGLKVKDAQELAVWLNQEKDDYLLAVAEGRDTDVGRHYANATLAVIAAIVGSKLPTRRRGGEDRPNADLLDDNGRVPGVRNGKFNKWFDDLSPTELDNLWADDKIRTQIETRIREPKGLHEWCMVCRAPKFKRWGVPMSEIQRFRTRTDELTWTHPDTGKRGGHGRDGSTKFHNELRDIIDTSNSLSDFNSGVLNLRMRWQVPSHLLPDLPGIGGDM